MAKYEIIYLFSPQISEPEVKAEIEKTNGFLTELGGKITKEDYWGLKDLAYEIKHLKQGYYHVAWFELKKKNLETFCKKLKTLTSLLRFLITAKPKKEKIIPAVETKQTISLKPKSAPRKAEELQDTLFAPQAKSAPKKEKRETSKKPKAEMEDLDKKLEEILNEEVL